MHKIMHTPLFVPVQKKSFDTIEIFIMTDEGKLVPFSTGKKSYCSGIQKIWVAGQFNIK